MGTEMNGAASVGVGTDAVVQRTTAVRAIHDWSPSQHEINELRSGYTHTQTH